MNDVLALPGAVEPRLAAEFPGLELRWTAVSTRGGPSPPELRARLRELADRGRGARVVAMRTQPVAHAYRSFYRHTGLDPDVTRIPSEQAALRRLLEGGFRSEGRIADALLVALVETGVPVWALRAQATQPEGLTIRLSRAEEPLGAGRLVIADARRIVGPLFGAPDPDVAARGRDREVVLVCAGVDGVPTIFLEEALWLCAEALAPD
jgi:DNA/RNA-binding domain of Phe-tRNA-synthetase-like protein